MTRKEEISQKEKEIIKRFVDNTICKECHFNHGYCLFASECLFKGYIFWEKREKTP